VSHRRCMSHVCENACALSHTYSIDLHTHANSIDLQTGSLNSTPHHLHTSSTPFSLPSTTNLQIASPSVRPPTRPPQPPLPLHILLQFVAEHTGQFC
jgi:hypothetical protein